MFVEKLGARQSKAYLLRKKDGSLWVLKQRKDDSVHDRLVTVIDTIGARIARSLGLRCNEIELIPSSIGNECKPFKHLPATLHSYMPGTKVYRTEKFHNLIMHQKHRKKDKSRGLTQEIIHNMTIDKDFPKLIAVDTFIGNSDRNRLNLLYDEEHNEFNAIDFGTSFKANLSKYAFKMIKKMIASNQKLESTLLNALLVYKNTLMQLVRHYPPAQLTAMFRALLKNAGSFHIKSGHEDFAEFSEETTKFITLARESHVSTKKLINALRRLLEAQNQM